MNFTIPVSSCPVLRDPPFVILLVWLGTGIGHRVLRLLRVPTHSASRLERGILAAALGLGLLQFLPYTLGMIGWLTPKLLGAGLLILLALFAAEMFRVLRGVGRALQAKRAAPSQWDRWGAACFVFAPIPLGLAFLQALCPPTDNDGLSYHLTAPKRWLSSGFLDYLPTFPHTNAPMGVEMLFTFSLALWSDTAAKLTHYALGLLALAAIYAFGRRLKDGRTGVIAMALFTLCAPQALSEYGAAYIDLGVTFTVVSAFIGWLLWRRTGAGGWLTAAALCAGFAASFKLTGAFYGSALAVLVWDQLRRSAETRPAAAKTALRFFGISLLPLLPWLWRSWRLTGNPVWPLLPRLFPTRDWNAAADRSFTLWFRYYNWGGSRLANWSLGKRKALLLLALACVVSGAALLTRACRNREVSALISALAALTALSIATVGLYFRFYMPVFPLLFCALLACSDSARWRNGAAAVALAALVLMFPLDLKQLPPRESAAAALGRKPRSAYLNQHIPLIGLWNFANANLPADAPILLAGFRPAFYGLTGGVSYYSQHPCYVTDAYMQQCFHMDDWTHYTQDVARYHIQYVAVPDAPESVEADVLNYLPARNELSFARRLARDHGQSLYDNGDVSLYRLHGI